MHLQAERSGSTPPVTTFQASPSKTKCPQFVRYREGAVEREPDVFIGMHPASRSSCCAHLSTAESPRAKSVHTSGLAGPLAAHPSRAGSWIDAVRDRNRWMRSRLAPCGLGRDPQSVSNACRVAYGLASLEVSSACSISGRPLRASRLNGELWLVRHGGRATQIGRHPHRRSRRVQPRAVGQAPGKVAASMALVRANRSRTEY